MSELLFEIFCEEIPARMQKRAGEDLFKAMDAGLREAGLTPSDSQVLTGPRRLTYVTHVDLRSPDVSEERKGPRVGAPERALEGFMRGAGISDISEAEIREDKKGQFYVAIKKVEGRDTADILKELIPDVMGKFPWPKSMKSGASDFRWVRPLRGLTLILDGTSVDVEVGGISSDDQVHGHRQMGPGPFTVTDFASYREQLEGDGHVVLERDARKAMILEQAKAVCAEAGLELVEDEGLLDEVAGLVEYPVALMGDMDEGFLELPDEVIRLTLKSHQKTFTVRDPKTGTLAAHFVIIANLKTADEGATIKAGNAKVISARLSDARFFQEEDRKKRLIDYYDKLDTVVFHNKLGTIRDKAERVAALAREIAPHVGADPNAAEMAAKLAKCDLVTQTVIEFTSLQGQVGRLMYEAEGGDPAIARAIEEHYKPQGPSDDVPTDPVSVAVALADKLDTLVGFWAIDEKPTGSKDPFALRRAFLGLMRSLEESDLNIELRSIALRHADRVNQDAWAEAMLGNEIIFAGQYRNLPADFMATHTGSEGPRPTINRFMFGKTQWADVEEFMHDRLRVYLRDQGHKHDVIDAVISQGGDDLLAIAQRVEALGAFLGNRDGENLVQGYKRAANILRAEEKKGALPSADGDSAYTAPEAAMLAKALSATDPTITKHLDAGDYPAALAALADLREPIDAFFESVIVNSDDPAERARRLNLLQSVVTVFHRLADFSRLDG